MCTRIYRRVSGWSRLRRALVLVGALLLGYVGVYLGVRASWAQVWEKNGKTYVLFPKAGGAALYYVFRPLSYVDGALTGMRFHIGAHKEFQ